jgi:hypothetical protein
LIPKTDIKILNLAFKNYELCNCIFIQDLAETYLNTVKSFIKLSFSLNDKKDIEIFFIKYDEHKTNAIEFLKNKSGELNDFEKIDLNLFLDR